MTRIFVALDAENCLAHHRRAGTLPAGLASLRTTLSSLGDEDDVVQGVVFCDPDLQADIAWEMRDLGLRVFTPGWTGPDAADLAIIDYLMSSLPSSTEKVVIGSGDHIFTDSVRQLRAQGKVVEMLALPGGISFELYTSVERCHYVETTPMTPVAEVVAA